MWATYFPNGAKSFHAALRERALLTADDGEDSDQAPPGAFPELPGPLGGGMPSGSSLGDRPPLDARQPPGSPVLRGADTSAINESMGTSVFGIRRTGSSHALGSSPSFGSLGSSLPLAKVPSKPKASSLNRAGRRDSAKSEVSDVMSLLEEISRNVGSMQKQLKKAEARADESHEQQKRIISEQNRTSLKLETLQGMLLKVCSPAPIPHVPCSHLYIALRSPHERRLPSANPTQNGGMGMPTVQATTTALPTAPPFRLVPGAAPQKKKAEGKRRKSASDNKEESSSSSESSDSDTEIPDDPRTERERRPSRKSVNDVNASSAVDEAIKSVMSERRSSAAALAAAATAEEKEPSPPENKATSDNNDTSDPLSDPPKEAATSTSLGCVRRWQWSRLTSRPETGGDRGGPGTYPAQRARAADKRDKILCRVPSAADEILCQVPPAFPRPARNIPKL